MKPPLKDPPFSQMSLSSVTESSFSVIGLLNSEQNIMIKRAIQSADKHGISLVPGRKNSGGGNCAFDSAIFNVNDRECFTNKFPMPSGHYRKIWVTDMKNRTLNDTTWKICPDREWEQGWNELLESGVYERGLFGDLMLLGIACGLKKFLLIFNTSLDTPHDPIYVCDPRKFGVMPDINIPIVLAYNMSHYESLHPSTDSDTEKTASLVQQYLQGNYGFGKKDLPFLLDVGSQDPQSQIMVKDSIGEVQGFNL